MPQTHAPNGHPPQASTPSPETSSQSSGSALELYADFAQQADTDSRGLRRSLIFAAVLHGMLLLVTFPNLYSAEIQEPEPPKVLRLSPTPKFKPPPPVPTEIPRPKARKVPIPDPTPEAPEPVRVETPDIDVQLPDVSGLTFIIPERPPEPPSSSTPIILHGGIERPKRIKYVAPEYTEIARKVRREGTVILETVIDVDGNVQDVKVLKSLSFGLTEAAVAAVEQWKYSPAMLNGKPVAVYFNLTVNFALQ